MADKRSCRRWDVLLIAGFSLGVVVALMLACKVGRPYMRERSYQPTRCGVVHVRFLNRTECHPCRRHDDDSRSSEEQDEDWEEIRQREDSQEFLAEEKNGWYAWARAHLQEWFDNLPEDLKKIMSEWEMDWGAGPTGKEWGMPEWGHHGEGRHQRPPSQGEKCDWWESFLKPHHDSTMHGMSPSKMSEMTEQDWLDWWDKIMNESPVDPVIQPEEMDGDDMVSGSAGTMMPSHEGGVTREPRYPEGRGEPREADAGTHHMGQHHSGHGGEEAHHMKKRSVDEEWCPNFDCLQVEVFYHGHGWEENHHHHEESEESDWNSDHNPPPHHRRQPKFARVHYSLYEVDKYPHCSYSSCMKDNYKNDCATEKFLRSMESALRWDHSLMCYHNPQRPDHVILTKQKSFRFVLHCLLWPTIYATVCVLALMIRHCCVNKSGAGRALKSNLQVDPDEPSCTTVSGSAEKYSLPSEDVSRPDGPAVLEGDDLSGKTGAWLVGPTGPPQYTQVYDGDKISLPPPYEENMDEQKQLPQIVV